MAEEKTKIKIARTENVFWIILLILACANFLDIGYIFLSILLFFYTIKNIRRTMVSSHIILLLFFSFSYFIFYWYHFGADITVLLKYLFFPWMSYMVGATFIRNSERKSALLVLTFAIAGGLFFHGTLNVIFYRLFHRVDESYVRLAYDFWRQDYISVTNHGLLFLIPIGVSIGMLFSKKRSWIVIACLILAVSTYSAVLLAYRTFFVIMGMVIIGGGCYLLFSSTMPSRKKIKIILAALLTILICIVVWRLNIADIRRLVQSSRLYRRMTQGDIINAGGRVNIWQSFFENWFQYPFGGEKIALYKNHSYVHNFWLDIYRVAGLVPFAFSIIATVDELMIQRRYTHMSNDRCSTIIINCVTIVVLLGFMVEPVYIANPYVYYYFLIIQGGMLGEIRQEEGICIKEKYSFSRQLQ